MLSKLKYDSHIKANLEKLVDTLTAYLKFYKRSYTILYPAYFFLALLFMGFELGSDRFLENLTKLSVIIHLSLTAALFFFLSTWFTTWYLKKLYGDHLERLKTLLHELTHESKNNTQSA